MKIDLIYLYIARDPNFDPFAERFVKTYQEFPAGVEHQLRVVVCNGEPRDNLKELFDPLKAEYHGYYQNGRDIGAQQFVACGLNSDWVVCTSSRTYFHRAGWLKKMVEAREQYGDGLYGAMASFEGRPHIRTCFYACSPEEFGRYPFVIETAESSYRFESGFGSFTDWFAFRNKPGVMVTWNGCYLKNEWRSAENIFRKGDQSNCLVFDRHTDEYRDADEDDKRYYQRLADGLEKPHERIPAIEKSS